MNSWLTKDSSEWTTRTARRSHQRWLTRVRRGVGAALAMALAVLGLTVAPFAHAADTAATIEKTIISPKSTYAVGETVTYRLTLQCSSLTGSCGIGTITDIFDSNLTVTAANVFLPTSGTGGSTPPPLTKSVSGQTLTITVGNATTPWEDGKGFDVLVTATVNAYPLTSNPIGTIPNSAKVDITAGQGATAGPVVINVTPPAKDWGLTKFKASPKATNPAPGELLTYEIHWTRPVASGGIDITSATLTDVLDPRFEYVSSEVQYPGTGTPVTTYDAATHTLTISGLNMQANTRMNCDASGCWSYTVVFVTVRVPPNAVDGTTPAPGTVFSNTATSNVTYADGTTGTLTGSTKVSIDAPQPSLSGFKSGPSSVPPGGALEWRLLSANNGNVTLNDFQVVDSLPVDAAGNLMVENVQLVRKLTSAMPLSPNTGTCCWSGAATV
ncbi:MAG TPA: isopeptide-forming domain-containing fimbrial protein [Dermatophilaceae bacterium]|jgi:fimbrial isopeptide formation D2 family protein|nr:isopeptide-forming domain-containing fimbrial protein [Dermatophilaceae bacterium]